VSYMQPWGSPQTGRRTLCAGLPTACISTPIDLIYLLYTMRYVSYHSPSSTVPHPSAASGSPDELFDGLLVPFSRLRLFQRLAEQAARMGNV